MNWYTRRRSSKPSLTSWTKPSPKCPDTNKQQPHCVHFTTNKLRQQATRPVVSTTWGAKNRWGWGLVSTLRNPCFVYTLLFYFCLRHARTMCLKIFHFFLFVGPGLKANFTKQRNQSRYTPRSSPLIPPP